MAKPQSPERKLRSFLTRYFQGRFNISLKSEADDKAIAVTIFPKGVNEEGDKFEGIAPWIIEQIKVHPTYKDEAIAFFENSDRRGFLRDVRAELGAVAEKHGGRLKSVGFGKGSFVVCIEYCMPDTNTNQVGKSVVRERCGKVEELVDHLERIGSRRNTPRRSGDAPACRPRAEQRACR